MKKFSMWGPLGDPMSPLTPVGYKVHWTRSPHQLPGSFPQSIRTLPRTHTPVSRYTSSTPRGQQLSSARTSCACK